MPDEPYSGETLLSGTVVDDGAVFDAERFVRVELRLHCPDLAALASQEERAAEGVRDRLAAHADEQALTLALVHELVFTRGPFPFGTDAGAAPVGELHRLYPDGHVALDVELGLIAPDTFDELPLDAVEHAYRGRLARLAPALELVSLHVREIAPGEAAITAAALNMAP